MKRFTVPHHVVIVGFLAVVSPFLLTGGYTICQAANTQTTGAASGQVYAEPANRIASGAEPGVADLSGSQGQQKNDQSEECSYSLSPMTDWVSFAEGTGNISVSAAAGCPWTAKSTVPWIVVKNQGSVKGNGVVAYSVGANQATAARTGTIAIAGRVFALTQAAAPTAQYTLSLTRSGSGRGKISTEPPGSVFKKGTSVVLRAVPDDNSVFSGWSGACSGTSENCTVHITSDKVLGAAFALKTYTIYVRPPANGVIHPSGAIRVAYGEKRRFQVIPLPGYRVSDVRVDKTSAGAVNTYTFDNIRADHVLEAVFVKQ